MSAYFDTSYLVALYVPNDHTAAALRYRAHSDCDPILFTPLHRLELRTVVRQCSYGRLITEADGRRILRHIEDDLDDGTLPTSHSTGRNLCGKRRPLPIGAR